MTINKLKELIKKYGGNAKVIDVIRLEEEYERTQSIRRKLF